MSSILEELFHSDIQFTQSEDFKPQCSEALDEVLRTEEAAKAVLTAEQWKLATNYLDAAQQYHELVYQQEFERGFLLGARIMLEVLSGKLLMPAPE